MNFSSAPLQSPKTAIPCLVEITLGSDGPRHSAMVEVGVDASSHDRADQGIRVRKFYWRAQVGVTSDALIVTPLNSPPNPLLDNRPKKAPTEPAAPQCDTSTLGGKIAHLFHHDHKTPTAAPVTGFPGVIDGKPLAGISVPLSSLDTKHYVCDTKSSETFLLLPVISSDPRDPQGQATLRFEFDNWLSSKADVEILGTEIQRALYERSVAAAGPAATPLSQMATRSGRDNDGSTHPSGDAPYKQGWQQEWHK